MQIRKLQESQDFGFVSSLLVVEEFRGLGYAKELFTFALKHLQGCQIALDTVNKTENFYEKFAFEGYFDLLVYRFTLSRKVLKESAYVRKLLSFCDVEYRAIIKDETVSSYAFLFPYKDGYKISIESEEINEAITLFFEISKGHSEGTPIYMQVSKLSPLHEAIAAILKMKVDSKRRRMYKML